MRKVAAREMTATEEKKPKRILGLVGSERRLGNCEMFVKALSAHVGENHELCLIRMPGLDIRPCKGCYRCILDMGCPHDDDMGFLLEEIAKADALIIATPVYYLGANSIFKRVLDRGFLFYDILARTYGKPCVLASIFGISERVGTSSQTLMTFASWLGLSVTTHVYLKAALPGEVLMTSRNREAIARCGRILCRGKAARHSSGCPYCGCDVVRMTRNGLVCTNCHGVFALEGANRRKIREGEIYGKPQYMFLHRKWLANMKQRFLKERKEALRTMAPYKDLGQWLR